MPSRLYYIISHCLYYCFGLYSCFILEMIVTAASLITISCLNNHHSIRLSSLYAGCCSHKHEIGLYLKWPKSGFQGLILGLLPPSVQAANSIPATKISSLRAHLLLFSSGYRGEWLIGLRSRCLSVAIRDPLPGITRIPLYFFYINNIMLSKFLVLLY